MTASVLAHVASSIPQKENLATEALAFIANRSSAARDALGALIAHALDAPVNGRIAHVATQVAFGDESRPDLVLRAEDGRIVGFIEAKFWAALTAAQPVEYLRRLGDAGAGVLVMLAPEKRLPTLRAEVIERLRKADLTHSPLASGAIGAAGSHIVFLSWSRVLAAIAAATLDDVAASSDVRQLAGLCERFETDGFIPVTREDLDDLDVPRRVLAFSHLVNDIVERAVAEGLLTTKGLKATHYLGATGRYAAFARAGCWIGLSHFQWSRRGGTPLWLRFSRDDWGRADALRELLRGWAADQPPRAYLDDDDRAVRVPLRVLVGAEKPAVIDHAITQLRALDDLMRAGGLKPLAGSVLASSEGEG